jgi:hypothetical protein
MPVRYRAEKFGLITWTQTADLGALRRSALPDNNAGGNFVEWNYDIGKRLPPEERPSTQQHRP